VSWTTAVGGRPVAKRAHIASRPIVARLIVLTPSDWALIFSLHFDRSRKLARPWLVLLAVHGTLHSILLFDLGMGERGGQLLYSGRVDGEHAVMLCLT
jgi:hypothetical protein